jgi:ankyrin repeat protein
MADDDYGFGSDEEEEVIDPSTLTGELYASVQANDTEKTLSFLELTVPPEHVDEECKWSMLHWAAYHGNVSVMQALLKAGAAGPYKKALTIFRGEGTVGMSAGEDVPRVVPTGTPPVLMNTPLHKAAKGGHLRVCWLLLSAGYVLQGREGGGQASTREREGEGNKFQPET